MIVSHLNMSHHGYVTRWPYHLAMSHSTVPPHGHVTPEHVTPCLIHTIATSSSHAISMTMAHRSYFAITIPDNFLLLNPAAQMEPQLTVVMERNGLRNGVSTMEPQLTVVMERNGLRVGVSTISRQLAPDTLASRLSEKTSWRLLVGQPKNMDVGSTSRLTAQ